MLIRDSQYLGLWITQEMCYTAPPCSLFDLIGFTFFWMNDNKPFTAAPIVKLKAMNFCLIYFNIYPFSPIYVSDVTRYYYQFTLDRGSKMLAEYVIYQRLHLRIRVSFL